MNNRLLVTLMITATLIIMGACRQKADHVSKEMNNMNNGDTETATFAGGCFWCMEADFEKLPGVIDVLSGYSGGRVANPSYGQVSAGGTGHREAVQVVYDPNKITYDHLLAVFWRKIDPTDAYGQFVDRGRQYSPAIFYHDDNQKQKALASRDQLEKSGLFKKPITTAILPFTKFYPAEDYHQDYYQKNPVRYRFYRYNSGRDQFLQKKWKDSEKFTAGIAKPPAYAKPSARQLKRRLSPLQYKVTQEKGTEPPFDNPYWDNKQAGIYVDIVSGEPLFSSRDKFESGTGWPSFFRPLEPDNIVEVVDRSFGITRVEVRSKHADSHLGHLFRDGPPPTGLRYCINSAALKFIPRSEMTAAGYGTYLELLNKPD